MLKELPGKVLIRLDLFVEGKDGCPTNSDTHIILPFFSQKNPESRAVPKVHNLLALKGLKEPENTKTLAQFKTFAA